jgi:hypothetical protein
MNYTPKKNARLVLRAFMAILLALVLIVGCQKSENASTNDAVANAKPSSTPARDLDLQQVAGNFISPITMVEPPDGSHLLFVVDQAGLDHRCKWTNTGSAIY